MLANIADIGDFADIIDARTPKEFADDHIPGAVNLPVLSDEERATIGVLHRQDAFLARRQGAALIARRVADLLDGAFADKPPGWAPLAYCARGGQRSGGLAEVMRRVGWRPRQLRGGYRAWRRRVIAGMEAAARQRWAVVAGKTGTGKTRLLAALAAEGAQTVDLEGLANHRGSVFGDMGAQPSQRRFESSLFAALTALDPTRPVFAECESRDIGRLRLPAAVLRAIRGGAARRVEATAKERIAHLLAEYRPHREDGELFARQAGRLAKTAGAATTARWIRMREDGELAALAGELLDFYDRGYERSLRKNYGAAIARPPLMVNPNDGDSLRRAARELIAAAAAE